MNKAGKSRASGQGQLPRGTPSVAMVAPLWVWSVVRAQTVLGPLCSLRGCDFIPCFRPSPATSPLYEGGRVMSQPPALIQRSLCPHRRVTSSLCPGRSGQALTLLPPRAPGPCLSLLLAVPVESLPTQVPAVPSLGPSGLCGAALCADPARVSHGARLSQHALSLGSPSLGWDVSALCLCDQERTPCFFHPVFLLFPRRRPGRQPSDWPFSPEASGKRCFFTSVDL